MEVTPGRAQPLGAKHDGRGTNFAVFSSVAGRVELCLFDERGVERRVDLPGRSGPYWHGYVAGVAPGARYGLRVHGPWEPARGHLCGPERLLLDPCARAVEGSVRWDDALFPLHPGDPSKPAHRADTAPFVPRSVVVDSHFDWQDDRAPKTAIEDTLIYEVHVKGFSFGNPFVPAALRGTYAGLAHAASIEYLIELGVTAVELLPVQQFVHRREFIDRGLVNYWGYDPICFFAPHNEYSSDRSPGGAVKEFKEMTRALHAAGLEVILDVVYNHTGEGGAVGPVLALKGLDNREFYRIETGKDLRYVDYTGTKNTLNAQSPHVRRMVLESLRYWREEMHVDGFRFDLAPIMAREGKRVDLANEFFRQLESEPALSGAKLIAEPWDLGENGYQLGRFRAPWSEWNDKFRDDVRDFWSGRNGAGSRFTIRFSGSPDIFRAAGRAPQAGVNHVTCHDGFTLHDLVSYQIKHNEANGEEDRDGPHDNHSWNCGAEGPTEDAEINSLRKRQKRNFLATLLLSQGVPMLLAGDEMGRTQGGNNNAYCQDNEVSWHDWERADEDLRKFVSSLIDFRKRHPVLSSREWLHAGGDDPVRGWGIIWYDSRGERLGAGADSPPLPIQAFVGRVRGDVANRGEDPRGEEALLVLFNPTKETAAFVLPSGLAGEEWLRAFDTASDRPWATGDASGPPGVVRLAPHSLAALVSRSAL
jgi:glycogen operon protein